MSRGKSQFGPSPFENRSRQPTANAASPSSYGERTRGDSAVRLLSRGFGITEAKVAAQTPKGVHIDGSMGNGHGRAFKVRADGNI